MHRIVFYTISNVPRTASAKSLSNFALRQLSTLTLVAMAAYTEKTNQGNT